MLNLQQITDITFRMAKLPGGYKPEDVDAFVDEVRQTVASLTETTQKQQEEINELSQENRQLQKKMDILAQKIEEYRDEEDGIKNALMSAQKLGDASVREARHKAEIIIRDSQMKAERIRLSADTEAKSHMQELEVLKQSVSDFRSQILEMYKQHLTLITSLPVHDKKKEEEAEEKSGKKDMEEDSVTESGGEPVLTEPVLVEPILFEDEAIEEKEEREIPIAGDSAGKPPFFDGEESFGSEPFGEV